jgi:hypothetical protein
LGNNQHVVQKAHLVEQVVEECTASLVVAMVASGYRYVVLVLVVHLIV